MSTWSRATVSLIGCDKEPVEVELELRARLRLPSGKPTADLSYLGLICRKC
ncbi:hypothetical protein J4G43_010550 [Bradyrhizobium barranii subsp. barranii]|uniref:Uncharacterized protein n=1 Tax=Bradyrhizobium barranii subsp. barranii TaxID=2823807 RepID=A0A939M2I0_9BRAD|nr:hypothetical protein [Bradyrhizobium barranii]UEM14639.1 hypothetical protein J4G43_010550 [Bradyrhizobium barranii subsp. barranii]